MGLWDQVKAFLRREAEDAKDWIDDSVGSGNAALDQAERRLSDDPSERLQMAIEDAEAGDNAFDAIRRKAEGRAAAPAAAAEVSGGEATFDPTDAGPAAEDVTPQGPPAAGLAMARLWVQVEGSEGHTHTLFIDETVGPIVGDEWFASAFPGEVEAHAEVTSVVHEDREVLRVSGPDLTAARARAIVAEVLAPRIGEDWEERLS